MVCLETQASFNIPTMQKENSDKRNPLKQRRVKTVKEKSFMGEKKLKCDAKMKRNCLKCDAN